MWLGPRNIPGADPCSFVAVSGFVLIIECTFGNIRQKSFQAIRALVKLRDADTDSVYQGLVVAISSRIRVTTML
ncbi:MAG: hypothetical protein ACXADL_07540 [Candidatus Thorarchaeota archaeon]